MLDRVMQLVADGALCVRGSHDDAAVAPPPQVENLGDRARNGRTRTCPPNSAPFWPACR